MMKDIFEIINEKRKKQNLALCTIVNTKGSTPRKTGAKMIVCENGEIFGTIGGGELEKSVIKNALEQIKEGKSKIFRHDLLHHHNMCCGGTVDIYIDLIMKKNKLYIFGAGHIGQALAKHAINCDFEIFLIDDRKKPVISFPEANELNTIHLPFEQALQVLPFDERTYICVMTYSHSIDRAILSFCVKKPFAYLGMIGSRRKVEMIKKKFMEGLNITEENMGKIDMPMGIDIGAEGPEEIALSILAKIIAVKNKKTVEQKYVRDFSV